MEDSPPDAELLLETLAGEGYEVTSTRVETGRDLQAALDRESWDLVLSDYSLPTFDAPSALAIIRAFNPELPFIIVSGTIGATFYVSLPVSVPA